ncbi:MAG TPA: tetratricopeptide repeat protein, partial [Acetobacteraceae bacterium]|nr:tetratricopeptide repeat protein [Acetobacteraceae bacterium]
MDQVSKRSASDWMRHADAARDAGRWEEAARAYAACLKQDPWDRAARVQLGHCLKEAGDLAGALAAYREAEAQGPEDSDLAVQIGHALKLIGDPEAAWRAYAHALALDPQSAAAARELAELGPAIEPLRRAAGAVAPGQVLQVVFDASDLIEYLRGARAPTGIQRVQFNIIVQALLDPPDDRVIAIVAFEEHVGFWREIPRDLFLRLWRLSRTGANIADPAWVKAIDECVHTMHHGRDFPFAPGAA